MNQAPEIIKQNNKEHERCNADVKNGIDSGASYTVDVREGASFNWSAGKRLTERGSKK
ncbi:MAG: hypothetical protein GY787_32150 [Alteromonadales bacterium]|nr:hypothetical protein [Alteromonadales bacterium]